MARSPDVSSDHVEHLGGIPAGGALQLREERDLVEVGLAIRFSHASDRELDGTPSCSSAIDPLELALRRLRRVVDHDRERTDEAVADSAIAEASTCRLGASWSAKAACTA